MFQQIDHPRIGTIIEVAHIFDGEVEYSKLGTGIIAHVIGEEIFIDTDEGASVPLSLIADEPEVKYLKPSVPRCRGSELPSSL